MNDDDGPPPITSMSDATSTPQTMTGAYPKYAPIGIGADAEDDYGYDADSESDERSSGNSSFYKNSMYMLIFAMAIAHIWTVYTLRTDMNIVLAHQEENSHQYKHIIQMLQKHTIAQWQIVPA